MPARDALYIGGSWAPPAGRGTIEVVDPTTEAVTGTVPDGTAEDADRAVRAAAAAFPDWSATPLADRIRFIERVAAAIEARTGELAALITREVGSPYQFSIKSQVGLPIQDLTNTAKAAGELAWEEELGNTLVVREPVGVVAAITPWNYPLHQICAKLAPALAAGCTVVLKPSEVAPLNAFELAEVLDEVGLPPGVVNVVTGTGPVAGEAIVRHPLVDMVSLTGSTRAGTRVMQLAAEGIKRVALELGGKSANVILDDADLEVAVPSGVEGCFRNGGQNCSALTRMLVPRARLEVAERLATAAAEAYLPGDPFDQATRLGPMVSAAQRERVRGYIRGGIEEGAKLLTGGAEAPAGMERGYFVKPTVFSEVRVDMTIAREEIFGPVLSILPYDSEEDAVRIANDTPYGLSGAVWSGDQARAERVARRLRTGRVAVNGGPMNPLAPFGGYKQSGIGRELGRYGLEEFLEVKSIQR
jgi:aldehyde dehydrogenase (NAD+)